MHRILLLCACMTRRGEVATTSQMKEYNCCQCLVQTIVDMSCGSGLFSRRFARSGRFSAVIAADFSESMLGQARTFFEMDDTIDERY